MPRNQRPTKEELEAIYLDTVYESKIDGESIKIRIDAEEQALSRLLVNFQRKSYAFITAYNPMSRETSVDENLQNQKNLKSALLGLRYVVYDGVGRGSDPALAPEPSFLVLGISFDMARALGREFRQQAIIYGRMGEPAKLIWAMLPPRSVLESESIDSATSNLKLCLACAEWAFARWKGWCSEGTEDWRDKPDLPRVPLLSQGPCSRCGGTAGLDRDQIYYSNRHGGGSTGLPEYFTLAIDEGGGIPRHTISFGKPYRDPWIRKRIPLAELEARMRAKYPR